VQYRLSILVKAGILRVEGLGRNAKYYFNLVVDKQITEAVQVTFSKIPFSLEAENVRKRILLPRELTRTCKLSKRIFGFIRTKQNRLLSEDGKTTSGNPVSLPVIVYPFF
jgi:hypothetical protein